eukprot:1874445-Amphidinium_carterae.1
MATAAGRPFELDLCLACSLLMVAPSQIAAQSEAAEHLSLPQNKTGDSNYSPASQQTTETISPSTT